MSLTIEEYLTQLKELMKDRDAAIVRDALSDAEEHLRNAMEGEDPSRLDIIIEEYGSPDEIAAAYEIMEERTPLGFIPARPKTDRNFLVRFFGVLVDPHAWGAVLYALISLVTGTLYFSWAAAGISLSISMIIMMIFSGKVADFIHKNPTLEMLALSFLLLIGFMLVIEGFHYEIPKGYIYFAVFFSLFVEVLNMKLRRKKEIEEASAR